MFLLFFAGPIFAFRRNAWDPMIFLRWVCPKEFLCGSWPVSALEEYHGAHVIFRLRSPQRISLGLYRHRKHAMEPMVFVLSTCPRAPFRGSWVCRGSPPSYNFFETNIFKMCDKRSKQQYPAGKTARAF